MITGLLREAGSPARRFILLYGDQITLDDSVLYCLYSSLAQ